MRDKQYDDIIGLPHKRSDVYPPMALSDRAAQFSSFAALKGYEEEIAEEGRSTEERPELGEEDLAVLNETFSRLTEKATEHPLVAVTYFEPDPVKAGGAVLTRQAALKKLDLSRRILSFYDMQIPFGDILGLEILS